MAGKKGGSANWPASTCCASRTGARQARRARQTSVIVLVCLVVAGLGVGGYFLFAQPTASSSTAASATASASPSASVSAVRYRLGRPGGRAGEDLRVHHERDAGREGRRDARQPDGKASYRATIRTNRGDVVIDLLNSKATCTVNSFVYLAAKDYFSNTSCHRLTTSGSLYVLQCGDPTGTGRRAGLRGRQREPVRCHVPGRHPGHGQHRAAGFQRQPVLHR